MTQDEKISCKNCIWRDQCENDTPCNDFDDGVSSAALPSEEEIELQVEIDREQYRDGFEKYTDSSYVERYDYFSVRSVEDLKKLEKGSV